MAVKVPKGLLLSPFFVIVKVASFTVGILTALLLTDVIWPVLLTVNWYKPRVDFAVTPEAAWEIVLPLIEIGDVPV